MPENHTAESDDFRLDDIVKPSDSTADHDPPFSVKPRSTETPGDHVGRRGWRINYWLLVGTVLTVAVVGPSLYFWRNFQVQRNADSLITRAESLEENEDWRAAADLYHRYLQLVPGNSQVVVARARAFDKTAESPDRINRAVSLLFQAVDAAPEDVELRLRLAERLYQRQRWEAAREQLRTILELAPDNLEAARLSALAWRAQLGPSRIVAVSDVADEHQASLQKHTGDPALSVSLATVYRENLTSFPELTPDQVADLADEVMDRMVTESPEDEGAYLARYRYRRRHDLEGADNDLKQALEIAPDSPEVMFAAASEFRSEDPAQSLQMTERLIEAEPTNPRGYQIRAEIQSQMRDVDEAIASLAAGLEAVGGDNYALKRTLLSVALDSGRLELAQETLKELNVWLQRFSPYLPAIDRRRLDEDLQVADARRLMLSGHASDAVPALMRLTSVVSEGSDADQNLRQREQRWQMLAEAYSQLQQWDLAADAIREASRLRPSDYRNVLAEASLARRGGNLPQAIQLMQEAALRPGAPPEIWLVLAEMLIETEFQRVGEQPRDWRRVRAALERAKPKLEGTPPFVSLKARWALADGRADDALTELRAILPVEGVPLESAGELALLFAAAGDSPTAEALTERLLADEQYASQGELTRIELMVRRRDYDGARQQLELLAQSGREAEKQEILVRLIPLEIEGGFVTDARQRLARLRDEGVASGRILDMGAALAFQGKDWPELTKYREALKRLEGPSGTVWRFYEALASLERKTDGEGMGLAAARDLLKDLEQLRPKWPSNLIVKGRLSERQGNPDEALAHYQEAVRQGARNALLIDWIVAGLYRQNRFEEAVAYLRQAGPAAGISSQASGLTLPAYLRQGRIEDALRVARTSAELHAEDALPQLLYGQALAISGDQEQAERQFRRAIELAPKDSRTWGGLIWFFAQSRQIERLRETLEQVAETVALSPAERALLAGRGLAMIGNRGEAAQQYQVALDARPEDPQILEELARFHLQSDLDRALELYRRLLAAVPGSPVARRSIALILGMRGTDEGLAEALELLKEAGPSTSPDDSHVEERLQAVLLMRGNEVQRVEAVERLSRLLDRQEEQAPIDRLLMARALELVGRPDEAQQQYQDLLNANATADVTSMYAAFLLRQERYEELESVLDELETLDTTGANPLLLRAELLAGMGRQDEIDSLVEQYVTDRLKGDDAEHPRTVQLAGNILRQHGRLEVLERILRSYATQDGGDMLIDFLLEQQRMGEALQLGVEFAEAQVLDRAPLVLLKVMTMMAARKVPAGLMHDDAEAVLEKALTRHEKAIRFLFDLGTLRVMQGRDEEAIRLYEDTLAIQPEYLPSMNNLAILLASIPERREEALRMIEELLDRVPDSAEVKDSHALVLLGCERYSEARDVMAKLLESYPDNPRFLFHFALTSERLGDSSQAKESFHAALSSGLEKEFLTPAEDDYVAELLRQHGSGPAEEKK